VIGAGTSRQSRAPQDSRRPRTDMVLSPGASRRASAHRQAALEHEAGCLLITRNRGALGDRAEAVSASGGGRIEMCL
jgi:hypothetical protein